jgi:hypothetical protein
MELPCVLAVPVAAQRQLHACCLDCYIVTVGWRRAHALFVLAIVQSPQLHVLHLPYFQLTALAGLLFSPHTQSACFCVGCL